MDTTEMMMTDKLNSGLIESMKEKIPEGANLANLLMDILYKGVRILLRKSLFGHKINALTIIMPYSCDEKYHLVTII